MARLTYNRRYLFLSLGSLAGIIALVSLTTPVSNIMMGLIFFGLALFFLINLGYLLLSLGGRQPGRRSRIIVILASVFLVLAAMFLSVQSLNWASGITLLLLAIGMLFYSSRRS